MTLAERPWGLAAWVAACAAAELGEKPAAFY